MFFTDESEGDSTGAALWLLRHRAPASAEQGASATSETLARVDTIQGGRIAVAHLEPDLAVVDNGLYMYHLALRMDNPGITFEGARLGYRFDSALPAALRNH